MRKIQFGKNQESWNTYPKEVLEAVFNEYFKEPLF